MCNGNLFIFSCNINWTRYLQYTYPWHHRSLVWCLCPNHRGEKSIWACALHCHRKTRSHSWWIHRSPCLHLLNQRNQIQYNGNTVDMTSSCDIVDENRERSYFIPICWTQWPHLHTSMVIILLMTFSYILQPLVFTFGTTNYRSFWIVCITWS